MIIKDDRTEEQKKTLRTLIVGTDRFMSYQPGFAEHGTSVAAWAVDFNDVHAFTACYDAVKARTDMMRVRVVHESHYYRKSDPWQVAYAKVKRYRPKAPCVHFHVYVWKGQGFFS